MKEEEAKKRDRDPFEEVCNGPTMVSIGDLIKSRPGAKAKPKAGPSSKTDKQRQGFRAPRQDACPEMDEDLFFLRQCQRDPSSRAENGAGAGIG